MNLGGGGFDPASLLAPSDKLVVIAYASFNPRGESPFLPPLGLWAAAALLVHNRALTLFRCRRCKCTHKPPLRAQRS